MWRARFVPSVNRNHRKPLTTGRSNRTVFCVIQPSLQEIYSTKSDEELLALAADNASLREDAKPILAQELQRRNLQQPMAHDDVDSRSGSTPRTLGYDYIDSRFGATPRTLIFVGALLLNTCIALLLTPVIVAGIGTMFPPMLVAGIGTMFHPHSLATLLWKLCTMDFLCAAGLGFFISRFWRTRAAVWTWVLPFVWFALRFFPVALSSRSQSVLFSHSVRSQFPGSECVNGMQSQGCINFLLFALPLTLTLIKGVSYSLGAHFSYNLPFHPKPLRQIAGTSTTTQSR